MTCQGPSRLCPGRASRKPTGPAARAAAGTSAAASAAAASSLEPPTKHGVQAERVAAVVKSQVEGRAGTDEQVGDDVEQERREDAQQRGGVRVVVLAVRVDEDAGGGPEAPRPADVQVEPGAR